MPRAERCSAAVFCLFVSFRAPALSSVPGVPRRVGVGHFSPSAMFHLPLWQALVLSAILGHLSITALSIYLHRCQTHRSIEFHPVMSHIFRFWLWFTTSIVTKQWVAVHRKHHATTEQPGDPHSPHQSGIWRVFFAGRWLYAKAARDKDLVEQYGVGTPDDAIERRLYSKYPTSGLLIMLALELALFGPMGALVWAIQIIWIPLWAAGVINGLGHWVGYRNGDSRDESRNLMPWGIIVAGEELHNNHHLRPGSAKLSHRKWEFDIGWAYISMLSLIGMVRHKTVTT